MKNIIKTLADLLYYYLICRCDKSKYLRSKGAIIGSNCDILTKVINFGTEPWLIRIGSDVTLTAGVVFITHDGSSRVFRKNYGDMNRYGNKFGKIVIRDNCFIGVNSIIMPGVTIGPNAIVGVGSIVTKDVPPDTVVAGVPARVVCTLEQHIERYRSSMFTLKATSRDELREELVSLLFKDGD